MPIIEIKDPVAEMGSEVVKGLEKYGPREIIDLCLPSGLTEMNGVPIHNDPIRDRYLARALVISTMGDWTASWKQRAQCPRCGKIIERIKPKTEFEVKVKAVICDDCLSIVEHGPRLRG